MYIFIPCTASNLKGKINILYINLVLIKYVNNSATLKYLSVKDSDAILPSTLALWLNTCLKILQLQTRTQQCQNIYICKNSYTVSVLRTLFLTDEKNRKKSVTHQSDLMYLVRRKLQRFNENYRS